MNVIDGGHFLYKIVVWHKRRKFQQIAAIRQFSENCVILFDRYHEQATIKYHVFKYCLEVAVIGLTIKLVHLPNSI